MREVLELVLAAALLVAGIALLICMAVLMLRKFAERRAGRKPSETEKSGRKRPY